MRNRQRAWKKLTMLTFFEDKRWASNFSYFLDAGKTEVEADQLAWHDLQREFPRLRSFDGCLPQVCGTGGLSKWSPLPVVIKPMEPFTQLA
jgi:hypothetical protein